MRSGYEDTYVKTYRSVLNHPLWQDKPYAKGQAWEWLYIVANFADSETLIKNKVVKIKRGQVLRSIDSLASAFGWGIKKTKNFLTLLESLKMVTVEGTPQGTLITIENYESFQGEGLAKDVQQETTKGQQGASEGLRNKKDKKDKKDKEAEDMPLFDFGSEKLKASVADWLQYKKERKDSYKATGLKALFSKIEKQVKVYGEKAVIDLIEESAGNLWKGIAWDKLSKGSPYQKPENTRPQPKPFEPPPKVEKTEMPEEMRAEWIGNKSKVDEKLKRIFKED